MPGRRRLVVLAIAATAVVGVPLGALTARSGHDPAPAPVTVTGPLTPAVVDDLITKAAQLDAGLDQFVRGCMADHGFPQLQQAWDLRRPGTPAGVHRALRIDPLETGPSTDEQALRFGMIGARDGFDGVRAAYVVSRNAGYDQRFAQCRQDFAKKLGYQVVPALHGFLALTDTMHSEFLERSAVPVERLLKTRLDCVRAGGYPRVTRELAAPMETLVKSAGVPPGSRPAPAPWTEPRPGPGKVAVAPPEPPDVYRPSAAEVALAKVYVRCGIDQGFTGALARAQVGPRQDVVAAHEAELAPLREQLVGATAAMERIHP